MKRNLLSWGVTLILILLGIAQVAQAQTIKTDAFEIKYIGATLAGDNNRYVNVSFSVKAVIDHNIEKVYFELPNGSGAISPVGVYTSTKKDKSGEENGKPIKDYKVQSAVKEPFHAVSFEGIGGIKVTSSKKVKEETFEYMLSRAEFASMTSIRVYVKSATQSREVTFTQIPPVQTSSSNVRKGDIAPLSTCSTPLPVISGPSDPCPGDIVTFAIQQDFRYKNIIWQVPTTGSDGLPSNWEIIRVYGENNHIAEIKIGDISGTVSANVDVATCGTQVVSKAIYIGDKIPVTLTVNNGNNNGLDDDEFEPGDLLVLNANAVPSREKRDYNYVWTLPSGWVIVWGAGTSSVVVQTNNNAGVVAVNVSSKPTSVSGEPIRYCGLGYDHVEMFPDDSKCEYKDEIVITGPDEVCQDGTYKFEIANLADPSEGIKYDFFLPDNMVLVSKGYGYVIAKLLYGTVGSTINVSAVARNASNCISGVACYPVKIVECDTNPVTLTSFKGASRNGVVELAWSTASEINNDRFEVERSSDGKSFAKVGKVKGNGNSTVVIGYSFSDRSATPGAVYYRLKQVDFDGTSEYSKAIAVSHRAKAGIAAMSVYPNPVTDGKFVIRFTEQMGEGASVRLIDLNGGVLHTSSLNGSSTETEINLSALNLKQGLYLITVTSNGQNSTQRVMIK